MLIKTFHKTIKTHRLPVGALGSLHLVEQAGLTGGSVFPGAAGLGARSVHPSGIEQIIDSAIAQAASGASASTDVQSYL